MAPSLAEASRDLLRQRVFEAIEAELAQAPWRSVSMAGLAVAAGVSRATLYNEFGNRNDLLAAYVMWEMNRYLDEVQRAIEAYPDDVRAAVVSAFELIMELASDHPLVRALEGLPEPSDLQSVLATRVGTHVVTVGIDRLTEILDARRGGLSPAEVRALCEVVVRMGVSHLTMPTVSAREAAEQLDWVLGPRLDAFNSVSSGSKLT